MFLMVCRVSSCICLGADISTPESFTAGFRGELIGVVCKCYGQCVLRQCVVYK
jgi:hypothetical protein